MYFFFFLSVQNWCMISINDLTKKINDFFLWKMNVINKCMWGFYGNIWKYVTCAYEDTTINYLKNFQSTPFLSLWLQNRCNGNYSICSFSFFRFFCVCVIRLSRGALYLQLVFVKNNSYSFGMINHCIVKTGYELWWSFIITVLLTFW